MQSFDNLLEKFLQEDIHPGELKTFLATVNEPGNQRMLEEVLQQKLEQQIYTGFSEQKDMNALFLQMMQKAAAMDAKDTVVLPLRSTYFTWRRVAVAASIILLVGVALYMFPLNRHASKEMVQVPTEILAPAVNKAVLTLADGTKISIDSAGNGMLTMQGNVKVNRVNEEKITYQTQGAEAEEKYNTLSIPRGSKPMSLSLADGSMVWLNAGSSITFPTAFTGRDRKVSMTGEAYFEISHNANMPFIVTKEKVEVRVLGTHFNVNAYDDEKTIRVTLLEGSVKVQSTTIKPGDQAVITDGLNVNTFQGVDIDEVMAWKNGLFKFNRAGIETVMKQMSRWYDVEVVYPDGIPNQEFGGAIRRDVSLSGVLKVLEESGAHFKIEGRKIIVLP